MRTQFFTLLLLATALVAANSPLFAQQKGVIPISAEGSAKVSGTRAVVIGISDYQDPVIPDLRFADRDAEAFANFLRSPAGGSLDDDHLQILINQEATAGKIGAALYWLIDEAKEGEQVIIYFSGHGDVEAKLRGQPGFLLCWDAPSQVYMTGGTLQLGMLQTIISTLSLDIKAKVTVITDACHSGRLAGSDNNGSQLTNANLSQQYANEIKILSCQPNEYSIEGEQWGGGRGAFSFNLVEALYGMADANQDLSVTLQEVGRYLEDHVTPEVAPISQVPFVLGNRSERLAQVDAKLLADLRAGRTNQMALFSNIESRNLEDEILATVDSNIRETYFLFKKALQNRTFFEPENACAEAYYEQLIAEPKLERLHNAMRRNYAAALQDNSQRFIKALLDETAWISYMGDKGLRLKFLPTAHELERAASLLGPDHYMYPILTARKQFFEGYLQYLDNRLNKNGDILKIRDKFLGSLQWQPNAPVVLYFLSRIYQYYLEMPDSAAYYAVKAIEQAPNWSSPYVILRSGIKDSLELERVSDILNDNPSIDPGSNASLKLQASWYYFQKKYDTAERLFKNLLVSNPSYPYSASVLWYFYWTSKRYKEAESVLLQFPNNLDLLDDLSQLYGSTREYDKYLSCAKKMVALDSTDIIAWLTLGRALNKKEQYTEAELAYKKSISLDSLCFVSWRELGKTCVLLGKYPEGETAYKKDIEIMGGSGDWLSLAEIYYQSNRYAEAEKACVISIERYTSHSVSTEKEWSLLGKILSAAKRSEDIVTAYMKALELDSTNAVTWNNLGNSFRNSKLIKEAEKAYKKAISLDSTYAAAWGNLGFLYSSEQRYLEAEPLYRKATALDSMQATYWNNLGHVLLQTQRYTEAELDLKRAIALNPALANSNKHLATVYFRTGRLEEAKQGYQKAIDLNADYAGAYLGMAYVLAATEPENTAKALQQVEIAIQKGASYDTLIQDTDLASLRMQTEQWNALMKKHFPKQQKD